MSQFSSLAGTPEVHAVAHQLANDPDNVPELHAGTHQHPEKCPGCACPATTAGISKWWG